MGVVKEITRCQFNISSTLKCTQNHRIREGMHKSPTQIHLISSWFCEKIQSQFNFFTLTFHYLDSSYLFHQNHFFDIFWTFIWNPIFFRCRSPRGNELSNTGQPNLFTLSITYMEIWERKGKGWTRSNRKRKNWSLFPQLHWVMSYRNRTTITMIHIVHTCDTQIEYTFSYNHKINIGHRRALTVWSGLLWGYASNHARTPNIFATFWM